MGEYCIVADFEWAVTPRSAGRGDRFYYLNEILSFGAAKLTRSGEIIDRFYALVRPDEPQYLYPVVLNSLRLDREALAAAEPFPAVYKNFIAFTDGCPILTWGGADRSAVSQNLSAKGFGVDASMPLPPMRDILPFIMRALDLHSPYPSLSATLSMLSLNIEEERHNALSDAVGTAQILSYLEERTNGSIAPLFVSVQGPGADTLSPTAASCLRQAKKRPVRCPECGERMGFGVWFPAGETEQIAVCSCERHGKHFCLLKTSESAGNYTANETVVPYTDEDMRKKYEAARRSVRLRKH